MFRLNAVDLWVKGVLKKFEPVIMLGDLPRCEESLQQIIGCFVAICCLIRWRFDLMPSFDVVSRTDLMEVDNAINGVRREINQRFDLSGTKCDIDRTDNTLTMIADDTMKMSQLEELLRKYLARRKVDQRALDFKTPQAASGGSIRQAIDIRQGIDADLGRKISKAVRGTKLKVQLTIQGNELRVSSKQRDELQVTIEFIKDMNVEQPLQYVNFRE